MKFNKITTILGIAVFTMAFATSSMAQAAGPQGGPPAQTARAHKAKRPLVDALAKLNLTDKQKSQVKQILANRAVDEKTFRKAHKGDRDAIKAHRKEEEKVTMDAIKAVLTVDQWNQLTASLHHGKKHNKAPAKP